MIVLVAQGSGRFLDPIWTYTSLSLPPFTSPTSHLSLPLNFIPVGDPYLSPFLFFSISRPFIYTSFLFAFSFDNSLFAYLPYSPFIIMCGISCLCYESEHNSPPLSHLNLSQCVRRSCIFCLSSNKK